MADAKPAVLVSRRPSLQLLSQEKKTSILKTKAGNPSFYVEPSNLHTFDYLIKKAKGSSIMCLPSPGCYSRPSERRS